ncbi:hypothetical protein QTN94_14355 [Vibrio sp. M250220]|uniref:hypothetical protein n=1 Tax=Vibrio sp. M250220 TaxID=3020894 RepID=UPI002F3F69B4
MKNVLLFILTCGIWGLVLLNRKYGFKSVAIALTIFFGMAAFGHIVGDKPQVNISEQQKQQALDEVFPSQPDPEAEAKKALAEANRNTSTIMWRGGMADIIDYASKEYYQGGFVESLTLVPSDGYIVPVSIQKTNNCAKGQQTEVTFRMGSKGDYVKGWRTCLENDTVTYEPRTIEGINFVLNKILNYERVCTESKEFGDYDCTYPINDDSKVMFEELYLPKIKKISQQKQNAL